MVEKIGHIKIPLTVITSFAAIAEISGYSYRAEGIVTFNLRDFPDEALEPFNLRGTEIA